MHRLTTWLASERIHEWFHTIAAFIWLLLTVPALLWWTQSVPFLVFASLWANVVSHSGNALSARAGRRANPDDPL